MQKAILLFFIFLFSCNHNKHEKITLDIVKESTSNGVNITTIRPQLFYKQMISNGIIKSTNKAELHFKISESIANINVINGQKVKNGQVLAVLDNNLLLNQLNNAKIDVQKAEYKLLEEKINFDLSDKIDNDIKPSILKKMYIKSGVLEAKNILENRHLQYDQIFLKAPFSGVIANLYIKESNYISSSEVFCTIINPNDLEVVFSILENEFEFVYIDQEVEIQSFANKDKKHVGLISEINPLVDNNGLIKIKAKLTSKNTSLFDGMHVKVFVNKSFKDVIVIPKEALVLRSNRGVVFTLEKGLAKWNYVEIAGENGNYYAIKKGLKETDTIIISGNLNLSHDAKVKVTFESSDNLLE